MSFTVEIRFYEELNDFIPREHRKKTITHSMITSTNVKDLIESYGVPHTEVDLVLVNGKSVDFKHSIQRGDKISVYPVFESFDITGITKLRPSPLREPRFILDVHLGKLARDMRMYGFDTLYRNDYPDEKIIRVSLEEKRIILTRDLGILKHGAVTHGYFVRSEKPSIQIQEVISRFSLKKHIKPLSRCIHCNGKITTVKKEAVQHRLKPNTRAFFNTFFQCTACYKVYWEGSHYEKMMGRFNA